MAIIRKTVPRTRQPMQQTLSNEITVFIINIILLYLFQICVIFVIDFTEYYKYNTLFVIYNTFLGIFTLILLIKYTKL